MQWSLLALGITIDACGTIYMESSFGPLSDSLASSPTLAATQGRSAMRYSRLVISLLPSIKRIPNRALYQNKHPISQNIQLWDRLLSIEFWRLLNTIDSKGKRGEKDGYLQILWKYLAN